MEVRKSLANASGFFYMSYVYTKVDCIGNIIVLRNYKYFSWSIFIYEFKRKNEKTTNSNYKSGIGNKD